MVVLIRLSVADALQRQMAAPMEGGRHRVEKQARLKGHVIDPKEWIGALKNPYYLPKTRQSVEKVEIPSELKPRKIVGYPAGPGIAGGRDGAF
jgi:hypothetical protein